MFSEGLLIDKCPFQGRAMPGKNCLFQGHIVAIANKFQRPNILQPDIQGFTADKMTILHYLAQQFEALVI